MAWTTKQIAHLNKMNKAAQDVSLGTLLTPLGSATGAVANISVIEETAAYTDFTDNEDTTGTYEFSTDIPAGATFLYAAITAITGFAGDTSATITIGESGGDVDRYNTGTPNVFTTAANGVSVGAPSGTVYHATASTPALIVTTDSDFSSVSAGSVTVKLYFLN